MCAPTDPIERRAAAILRREGGPLPLSHLRSALVHTLGPRTPDAETLHERLRTRRDLFRVLAPRDPPWRMDAWPDAERRAYADALAEFGYRFEPRVALVTPPEPPDRSPPTAADTLARLEASLGDLWAAVRDVPGARADVAEAAIEAYALRRALTRPAEPSGS